MKKVLVVLLVVLILVLLGLVLVFGMTSGMVNTADGFFRAAAGEDFSKAKPFLAEGFLAETSLEDLQVFMRQTGLGEYKKASWGERSVSSKGVGELDGTVETKAGGILPVHVTFVKEKGAWKILALKKTAVGASKEGPPPMPADAELKALAADAVHAVALAINARDFGPFYNGIAKLWQAQTTKEELLKAFQPFVQQNIDLSVLRKIEPVLNAAPKINDEGMLVLQGYYPSTPSVVHFTTSFVYEHPKWALGGINLQVK